MPHADALALPASAAASKRAFYAHVCSTARVLLAPAAPDDPAANWVTACANAASLLFGSYENYAEQFGTHNGRRVNWAGPYPRRQRPTLDETDNHPCAGFYVVPSLLSRHAPASEPTQLYLGPFHGRPACLSVSLKGSSSRPVGVCAAAFNSGETVVVEDVNARPGHIACDGVTQSEIVVPVVVRRRRADGTDEDVRVGVLDVDCEALGAFDDEDRRGLEEFVEVVKEVVRWEL
jgi:L-methionine (R)-S-oxide reductase